MKLFLLSVSTTALNALALVRKRYSWIDEKLTISCVYAGDDSIDGESLHAALDQARTADFVLLDLMGVGDDAQQTIRTALSAFPGWVAVTNSDKAGVRELTRLGKFTMAGMERKKKTRESSLETARKMMRAAEKAGSAFPIGKLRDMRNYSWITKYWRYADETNIHSLLCLIAGEYGAVSGIPGYKPPRELEDAVIFDPRTATAYRNYDEWAEACSASNDGPNVAVLYNTGRYPVDTHPAVGRFLDTLESSCCPVPVAINRITPDNRETVRSLLPKSLDGIFNLLSFRLGQGPMGGDADGAVAFLRELNVPVMHPFFITRRSIAQWENDPHGTQPSEFLISIFLPELDGCIETIPIGAVNPDLDAWGGLDLLSDRVEKVIARMRAWRNLRHKPNHEKRVAIVMYNYPPGEGNIGSGAFLDAFSSVDAIIQCLKAEGYRVGSLGAEYVKTHFASGAACNAPRWGTGERSIRIGSEDYAGFTNDSAWASRIDAFWGAFPGTVESDGETVGIPGFVEGNIFVGLQPVRTSGAVSAQDYHDPHKPPHHQYAAFYRRLEYGFEADAIIHVGTHGTLEFLPGKENAMSADCFPDAFIGTVPHLYLYYSGNPSESSIAKRRSHAVMISHLQPPFTVGGIYGELRELESRIEEHAHAENISPSRVSEIETDIRRQAENLGWDARDLVVIASQLKEIKRSLVPGRLHTFGMPFSHDEAIDFLVQFVQYAHDECAELIERAAQDEGFVWSELRNAPDLFENQIALVRERCRCSLEESLELSGKSTDSIHRRVRELYGYLVKNDELAGLCAVLDGGYLSAGLGGDPFRNPEVLPSGRNLYQFDPRSVPSPSATRVGIQMAENMIASYRNAHGQWPQSVAVVLWGLETSKTNGESVAQILHLLGVRRVRVNAWETRLEVIPVEELKRPRVDVTVQMSGFLRDLFPNVVEMIGEAMELVGALKESDADNPILSHARALKASLQEQGYSEEDSHELSLARVFGPDASVYGTAVTGLVKSGEWQTETELVDAYTHSLRFVYTKRHRGVEMKRLLKENLKSVEMVGQVRSSMDYEITDLDHYYEFLGGLSRTVQQESGRKAMILVSDSHEGAVRTETVRRSMQRGIRSRLLNPKWQDGILGHEYHGAQQFADRMENLVGLAATTGEVDNALFEHAARDLILNRELRDRLRKNNPHALRDIVERFLEANGRGYWNTDEQTLDELKSLYLSLEGEFEAPRDDGAKN